MTRITVIGGTGYAGGHIVHEGVFRGHEVTSFSRKGPSEPVSGVTYLGGDVLDTDVLAQAVTGTDVVVVALSPRGALEGRLGEVVRALTGKARAAGVRVGVVGGAGSLLVTQEGPALAETEGFPDAFKAEASELAGVLEDLRSEDPGLGCFYLSPAPGFGAWAPGEHTGTFRLGGDILIVDEGGQSTISGADYAHAFVDEIEDPAHRGQRFSVAY